MGDHPPRPPLGTTGWERKLPTFVVGCGHSGTSLATRLIGAHSHIIAIPGETKAAWRRDPVAFEQCLREFDAFAAERHRDRWVEKTPRHVRRISFIFEHATNCSIICMLRDPRDVCFSLRKAIARWKSDNERLLPYLQEDRCLLVRYEDLVADPATTTKLMMSFLGESYEARQLEFHLNKVYCYASTDERPSSEGGQSNHGQLRNWQINQPIFDGRERWKEGLSRTELTLIRSRLAPLAATLGYDLSGKVVQQADARSRSAAIRPIAALPVSVDKKADLKQRDGIMEPDKFDKKPHKNKTKADFTDLRSQLEATENGKVRARGLGVFIIKTVTEEVEGQVLTAKRVKLRLAGSKARKRQPAPPQAGGESPASEHDA
jgi:hypothetical protein